MSDILTQPILVLLEWLTVSRRLDFDPYHQQNTRISRYLTHQVLADIPDVDELMITDGESD